MRVQHWLACSLLVACTRSSSPPAAQAPYDSQPWAPSGSYALGQPATEVPAPAPAAPRTATPAAPPPSEMPADAATADAYHYDVGPQYIDVNTAPQGSEVPNVAVFYQQLEPYGQWYDDPDYGYVFAPQETNYVPYSNGRWANAEVG